MNIVNFLRYDNTILILSLEIHLYLDISTQ